MPVLFWLHHILLWAFLCILLLTARFSSAATDTGDVASLSALNQAWASASLPWDSGDPCESKWLGITCDSANTRVISLHLPNQRISGTIPSDISGLTSLQNLDLSYNPELGGIIPPEIVDLVNLKQLWLLNCSFSGTLPTNIGNLINLEYLGLNKNSFTGGIPPSIGYLSKLKWLDLAENKFSGQLPVTTTSTTGLDMLTNAEHFHLYNNSFSGNIPPEIFSARMSLLHILLNNNQFDGGIPSEVGDLPKVNILRLDGNSLTGEIPVGISQLTLLTSLQLNNNSLSGPVPDLSALVALQYIDLGHNGFDSTVFPSWLSSFSKLSFLSFDAANLTGELPTNLFSLSMLSTVTLSSNQINGSLDLQNSSSSLTYVDVRDNNISVASIGAYTGTLLALGNPACTTDPDLQNSNCGLVGTSSNPTTPATPSSCGCSIGLEPNPTSSECLCSLPLTGLLTFVAVNEASIDVYLMPIQVALASNLSLSTTQISLTATGTNIIVTKFWPYQLSSWTKSESLSIANTLINQGVNLKAYGSYIFQPTFYDTGARGQNSGLSTAAKAGIGVGVSIAAIGLIVVGVFSYLQKKRADKAEHINHPFAAWADEGIEAPKVDSIQCFSFSDLKKATDNFSANHSIGEGGYGKVYYGVLPSKQEVAIKRAKPGSMQGAQEFKNEIELLSRLHHKNLVNLVGFCYEQGEQMLVYEFMPNGTLQYYLKYKGMELDWKTRVRIALDAAKGLAYLHNGVDPPVIHRDVKSANILLDPKLVAKVADFGLSKINKDGNSETVPEETQVKGTYGYLDPHYYSTGKVTEKSDVYSFGAVLVEIISGKPAVLFPSKKNMADEVGNFFRKNGLEGVIPLLDGSLTDYPEKEMGLYVELALQCEERDPTMRPSMVEVVKDLQFIESGWSTRANSKKTPRGGGGGGGEDFYPPLTTPMDHASEFEYSGAHSILIEPK